MGEKIICNESTLEDNQNGEIRGNAKHQKQKKGQTQKHTAASIRWSSPTQLLISRSEAYLWLIEREAEFSTVYGRMYSQDLYLK